MRSNTKRWLLLTLWVFMLLLAATACMRPAGGGLEATDLAQVNPTFTLPPSPSPEPSATPAVLILEVTPFGSSIDPNTLLQGTMVADSSLFQVDEFSMTQTAAAAGIFAQEEVVTDPLLLSATAIVAAATQTAAAPMTQTAQAIFGPTLTPTLDPNIILSPGPTFISGSDCIHEVIATDRNLFRISLRYGVSVDAIARASGITNANLIYLGQQLTIPGCGTGGNIPPSTSVPGGGGTVYTVQQGDTLFQISLRYGVLVNSIAAANGISNINMIYIGQQLVIPGV
jgi:hypothetical protein